MRSFLLSFFGILIPFCVYAEYPHSRATNPSTYTFDPREYVEWGNDICPTPYDKMVQMVEKYDGFWVERGCWGAPEKSQDECPPGDWVSERYYVEESWESYCTAQYVAPNIILTALHCVVDTDNNITQPQKFARNCHGNIFPITVIQHGDLNIYKGAKNTYGDHSIHEDWALLRINDSQYFSNSYFKIDNESVAPTEIVDRTPGYWVNNSGWGALPILSDKQINDAREYLAQYIIKRQDEDCTTSTMTNRQVKEACFDYFFRDFIFNNDKISFLNEDDSINLKLHRRCALWPHYNPNPSGKPDFHYTHCYVWGGNSGGPYYSADTELLRGIASGGSYSLPKAWGAEGTVVPTATIFAQVEKLNPSQPTPENTVQPTAPDPQTPNTSPKSPDQPTPENSQGLKDQIIDAGTNVIAQMQDIESMSPYQVLELLGRLAEYKKLRTKYERALARERSLPNRILGAAAIGVTGIGGMELLSGLAEKQADADAERDMRAYLATFRCDYGQGRNIMGGEKNITLPTSPEQIKLSTEYKQIASALQIAKESLDMLPGIESEIVLDSATTGLYDNSSTGITSGAFTSLSRALTNPDGPDAQAWAQQKSDTKKKTNTGAILTGTGVVGGTAGNIIISNIDKHNSEKQGNTATNTSSNPDTTSTTQSSTTTASTTTNTQTYTDINKLISNPTMETAINTMDKSGTVNKVGNIINAIKQF